MMPKVQCNKSNGIIRVLAYVNYTAEDGVFSLGIIICLTDDRIFMKISPEVRLRTRKPPLNFGSRTIAWPEFALYECSCLLFN